MKNDVLFNINNRRDCIDNTTKTVEVLCIRDFIKVGFDNVHEIKKGATLTCKYDDNQFYIDYTHIDRVTFFTYFKPVNCDFKLTYSDFEYILCNRVFTMAVLFPNDYSGVHHLVIQDWGHTTYMITSNKTEDVIRVSFPDSQEVYSSYEDALEGIYEHVNIK